MTYSRRTYTLRMSDNRSSAISFHIHAKYHNSFRYNYTLDSVKKLIGILLRHEGMVKVSGQNNSEAYFLLAKRGRTYFLNGQKISMENAAKALREAGAVRIDGWCLARSIDPSEAS